MSREQVLESAEVRALFSPQGDRFVHGIELLKYAAVIKSVDGPAEAALAEEADKEEAKRLAESWPQSPPLQDVHLEERPEDGLLLALMVGRAGTSHWSISCELQPAAGELTFDVACRVKEPALWLGSTYQLPPGMQYQGDRHSGDIHQDNAHVLSLSAESPAVIGWDPEQRFLQIRPMEGGAVGEGKFPQTIRWRYQFRATSAEKSAGK